MHRQLNSLRRFAGPLRFHLSQLPQEPLPPPEPALALAPPSPSEEEAALLLRMRVPPSALRGLKALLCGSARKTLPQIRICVPAPFATRRGRILCALLLSPQARSEAG